VSAAPSPLPEGYELRAVTILSLGFGLVGIDRFMISAMFPTIARDLQLGYGDIGTITGALSIAWGVSALFMGNLSDRIGRRKVLVGSLLVFSLLIGTSSLAAGFAALVLVRVLMGFADGAYTPASILATIEASPPERHGRNLGIQQMMTPLLGLGIAPIVVTQLLQVMDWRWIFPMVVLPGFVVAWFTWRWIDDAPGMPEPRAKRVAPPFAWSDYAAVLRERNIRLLTIGMLCWLTCLVITSAFLPSYLLDHLHLGSLQMGGVMSAIGLGATCGTFVLPWMSDRIGRRPVMLLCTVGAFVALVMLSRTGADVTVLFVWLFLTHFFNFALIALTVGPVCAESAPPALMATASGVVIAVGEIFGGGIAPAVGGFSVAHFGIHHLLWLPMAAMVVGFVVSLLIRETAPRVLERVALRLQQGVPA
jgi:predicted MFS family arabinose efflux permease